MHDLGEEKLLLFPRSFCKGNVPRNFRGSDDPAVAAEDRRHRQRNINQRTILAFADRFIMADALAAPQPLQNGRLLVYAIGGEEERYRLTNDLLSAVAKKVFRPFVPALNNPLQVLADDRVVGRF